MLLTSQSFCRLYIKKDCSSETNVRVLGILTNIILNFATNVKEACILETKYLYAFAESHNASVKKQAEIMGLLPDTQICRLDMRRECRECFPRHRLHRKPLVSDPDLHHARAWSMWGSLTRGGGESVPDISGACVTRNVTYLARVTWAYFAGYILHV